MSVSRNTPTKNLRRKHPEVSRTVSQYCYPAVMVKLCHASLASAVPICESTVASRVAPAVVRSSRPPNAAANTISGLAYTANRESDDRGE